MSNAEDEEETVKLATELFYSCNPTLDEQDGTLYLPINDLSKIQASRLGSSGELNLEELVNTFWLLDVNGDGKLTLEEFIAGFSQFWKNMENIQPPKTMQHRKSMEVKAKTEEMINEMAKARRNSAASLKTLRDLLTSNFYQSIAEGMPPVAVEFRSLINQASGEMDEIQKQMKMLEGKLESSSDTYRKSMEQAYAELDIKLRQLGDTFNERMTQRFSQLRAEYEQTRQEKADQMEEMKAKIVELNKLSDTARQDNQEEEKQISELRNQNDGLMGSLEELEQCIEESKEEIEQLQATSKQENAKRERLDASTCKRVQIECEELIHKLTELREINRRLRDERDEALQERLNEPMVLSSLMDEVNEAFGQKTISRDAAETASGADSLKFHSRWTIPNENHSPQNQGVVGVCPSLTDLQSDEEYEFEQPWDDSLRVVRLGTSPHTSEETKAAEMYSMGLTQEPKIQHKQNLDAIIQQPFPKSVTRLSAFKVIIVGHGKVGKTAFVECACRMFNSNVKQDFGQVSVWICQVPLDGQITVLSLLDTPGRENYAPGVRNLYHGADGIVFMFDINSMKDFNDLTEELRRHVKKTKKGRLPWDNTVNLLIGNKCDAAQSLGGEGTFLTVPRTSTEALTRLLNATYFEVSSVSGQNVQLAVEELVRLLRNSQETALEINPELVAEQEGRCNCKCFSCC
ncbi:unnamed protein product [Dicrocoelium dendriticum]|nr:unnamed protein product [Dicrocoelium dendriticum]